MGKLKKGDKVKIVGVIRFGQDMNFWEGEFPDNMVFTVKQILDDNLHELTAPGYGEKDNYGNGAIFVYSDWVKNLEKV